MLKAQAYVAEKLGFGQSALSQYLCGKIPLNILVLSKFSKLIKLPPQEISPNLSKDLFNLIKHVNNTEEAKDSFQKWPFNFNKEKNLTGSLKEEKHGVEGILEWIIAAIEAEKTLKNDRLNENNGKNHKLDKYECK